jgi:SAM-dependent methyltransferase
VTPAVRCHACGAAALQAVPGYARLSRVTSDCRSWPAGGSLVHCSACGLVQAPVTDEWRRDCRRIYQQYSIYHQGAGREPRAFNGMNGKGHPRSEAIVRALAAMGALPDRGRLLDVGCGNGAFLRAFGAAAPGWRLNGLEVHDRHRAAIESLPGVERLFLGDDVSGIDGTFDLISIVHVLEHLPSPGAVLRRLWAKLAPGGLLVVQVPDCRHSFMLPVADHCSHFSVRGLERLIAASGFTVLAATTGWVSKEVSIVARRSSDARPATTLVPFDETDAIVAGVAWLDAVVEATRRLAERPAFGLFGTAIAATWLDQELAGAARYFVDEDPSRIGRTHRGRPIVSPAELPDRASVFVALPRPLAERVSARLGRASVTFAIPPPAFVNLAPRAVQ